MPIVNIMTDSAYEYDDDSIVEFSEEDMEPSDEITLSLDSNTETVRRRLFLLDDFEDLQNRQSSKHYIHEDRITQDSRSSTHESMPSLQESDGDDSLELPSRPVLQRQDGRIYDNFRRLARVEQTTGSRSSSERRLNVEDGYMADLDSPYVPISIGKNLKPFFQENITKMNLEKLSQEMITGHIMDRLIQSLKFEKFNDPNNLLEEDRVAMCASIVEYMHKNRLEITESSPKFKDMMNIFVSKMAASFQDPGLMWSFDPTAKILWASLILSCVFEPSVFPKFMKMGNFKLNMLTEKDGQGISLVHYATVNNKCIKYIMDMKEFDIDKHFIKSADGFSPLHYSILRHDSFVEITNHKKFTNNFLFEPADKNISHLLSEFCNWRSFKHLAEKKIISKKMFYAENKRKETCLDILIDTTEPNLINFIDVLLDNGFITQKSFDKKTFMGNLFQIICRKNPQLAMHLLDKKLISKNTFQTQNYSNALCDSANSLDLVKKITGHEYFDQSMLTVQDRSIFECLLQNDVLKFILQLPCVTKKFIQKSKILRILENKSEEAILTFLNSGKITTDMIGTVKCGVLDKNSPLISIIKNWKTRQSVHDLFKTYLLNEELLYAKCDVFKDLVINKLMEQTKCIAYLKSGKYLDGHLDDRYFGKHSVFERVCLSCPNSHVLSTFLKQNCTTERLSNCLEIPFLFVLYNRIKGTHLRKEILLSDYFRPELTELTDKNKHNIFYYVSFDDSVLFNELIKKKKFTKKSINNVSSDTSVLIRLISTKSDQFESILNHPWINKSTFEKSGLFIGGNANILGLAVVHGNTNHIKHIMDHKFYHNGMFKETSKYIKIWECTDDVCLNIVAIITHPKFDLKLLEIKSDDETFFDKLCSDFQQCVIKLIEKKINIKQFITNNTLKQINNPNLFKIFIENDWIEIIDKKIIDNLAKKNSFEVISQIFRSRHCSPRLVKDSFVSCVFGPVDFLQFVMDIEYVDDNLLESKNPILANVYLQQKGHIEMLLKHPKITGKLITGECLVDCATDELFQILVKNNKFNPKVLEEKVDGKYVISSILKIKNRIQLIKNYINDSMFHKLWKNGENILAVLIDKDPQVFAAVLENKLIDKEKLLLRFKIGEYEGTCINMLTVLNLHHILKFVLSIDLDFTNILDPEIDDNYQLWWGITTLDTLKTIVESKYFKEKWLVTKNKYDQSPMQLLCTFGDLDMFQYILTKFPKYQRFTNGNKDTHMHFDVEKDCLKYLLSLNLPLKQNSFGETPLHKHQGNKLELLLDSKQCTKEVLAAKDNNGNNILHFACQKDDLGVVTKIINHANYTDLLTQNNLGQNPLILALQHNVDAAKIILKHKYKDKILSHIDFTGNSTFNYLTKFGCLEKKHVKVHRLHSVNNKQMKPIAIAAKYCPKSMKLILGQPFVELKMFYTNHTQKCNAYLIAAQHQPESLKLLLKYNSNNSVIHALSKEKLGIFQTACKYNSLSAKYLLDMAPEIIKKEMLFKNKNPPIHIACRNQPDALKYILKSEYINSRIINLEVDGMNCVQAALRYQPKSLLYLEQSEHCTDEIIGRGDDIGYHTKGKLIHTHGNFSSFAELAKKLSIMKQVNVIAKDKACPSCYEFQDNVLLNPCAHRLCVACSIRVSSCPICKTNIRTRSMVR